MITFLTRKTGRAASASVAIGTATCFVLSTAGVSLMIDRGAVSVTDPSGWTLRGAIAPSDAPAPDTAKRAAGPNARRWT